MAFGSWPPPRITRCSEENPGYGVNVSFIRFHDWIVFHCVFIPHTFYALSDGTPLTGPSFGCYE